MSRAGAVNLGEANRPLVSLIQVGSLCGWDARGRDVSRRSWRSRLWFRILRGTLAERWKEEL